LGIGIFFSHLVSYLILENEIQYCARKNRRSRRSKWLEPCFFTPISKSEIINKSWGLFSRPGDGLEFLLTEISKPRVRTLGFEVGMPTNQIGGGMARNTSSWGRDYFDRGILSWVVWAEIFYGIWGVGVLLGEWVELRVGERRVFIYSFS